jgi:hypothetical protein
MKLFKSLEWKETKSPKGIYATMEFDNGFTASVIRNEMSYGNRQGLYELAVLKNDCITSNTDITDDVEGWLDEKDVERTLYAMSKMDSEGNVPKDVLL